jgi:hypothetical protein
MRATTRASNHVEYFLFGVALVLMMLSVVS